jgi:uncharacterized protein YicC (UPF0701 family)
MKWLKRWIIGLLAGQAIGLFASKPALKKKLATAEGADKVKVVFDELVDFNKWLITSIDLTKLKADLAFRVEHLQEEIEQLTTQWSDLSQEKIQQWIGYLKTTTDELKNDVGEYVQDLDEKHQLTTKLTKLKDHITDLQTKVKG